MLCSQEPEVLRGEFCPSFVNLEILKELRLQQEIEDAHDNKESYNTWSVWDAKNHVASQKTSIRKRHAAADGEPRGTPCGRHGRGSGDCKHQRKNWHDHDPKSAKYCALANSVATLSKNVNVIATHMSGKSNEDEDAKPAADGKMASNSHNSFHPL